MEPTSGREIAGCRLAGKLGSVSSDSPAAAAAARSSARTLLPMLLAVAAGIHSEIDIRGAEARPPVGRCARADETELVRHRQGVRSLRRVGEETSSWRRPSAGSRRGCPASKRGDGAPADEHVQLGRAGIHRVAPEAMRGSRALRKSRPGRIAEAEQRDRVNGLLRAARQERLQIPHLDHDVSSAVPPSRWRRVRPVWRQGLARAARTVFTSRPS